MNRGEQAEQAQLVAENARLRRLLPRFVALSLEVRGTHPADDLCWFVCRGCGQSTPMRSRKDLRESEIPHGERCPVGEAMEVLG